jgi:hypothetical protein
MSTNPLEALLLGAAAAERFPPNSRYHGIATRVFSPADARPVAYLARRFVPPPSALTTSHTVRVSDGDRLDRLAAVHLGDAELYWRLCDANGALLPAALETVDGELRVPAAGGGSGD